MLAHARYVSGGRLRDWFSLLTCASLTVVVATLVAQALAELGSWMQMVLVLGAASFTSWVLADLTSGAVHYFADNFGSPSTPLVGRSFIAPFRQHHTQPDAILEHDFAERNGNSAAATLPALLLLALLPPSGAWGTFVALGLLQLCIWVALTNEIHALAHRRHHPRVVRWLQRKGIILSPEHHAAHHGPRGTSPSAGVHYCITSGFCDRLMSRASLDQ